MMINQLNGDRGIVAGGGISGFWFLVSGFVGFWLAQLGGIYPAD